MFFSWTLAIIVALGGILLLAYNTHSSDPHGLFHLSLNKLPGESEQGDPRLNMGYWKVGHAEILFRTGLFRILTSSQKPVKVIMAVWIENDDG